ncbi:MAG TPA: glycerophosphodiester phosphodiesterase [Acidimicrobiales bacterium]|nr:glycerophosphodiester phosphodiesterase [Acidimicrobiales bacterium]
MRWSTATAHHVFYQRKANRGHPQGIPPKSWENVLVVAVLAHRGASQGAVENTVEAFCEARRLGADGVELDVRRSADGALVVHHDAEIPGAGMIATLKVTDLPVTVPLLDAAVVACGDLLINIEMKDLPGEPGFDPTYPLAGLVATFVAERDLVARVIVSSFDLAAVDAVRVAEPAVATGWLTPSGFDHRQALESVVAGGHSALHPHHNAVTRELVTMAHQAGVAINTWTVDEADRMRALASAGVDAIITNRPDLAKAVLSR